MPSITYNNYCKWGDWSNYYKWGKMCDYHVQLNHVQYLFYIITYSGVMINYVVSFLGQQIYFILRYLEL